MGSSLPELGASEPEDTPPDAEATQALVTHSAAGPWRASHEALVPPMRAPVLVDDPCFIVNDDPRFTTGVQCRVVRICDVNQPEKITPAEHQADVSDPVVHHTPGQVASVAQATVCDESE